MGNAVRASGQYRAKSMRFVPHQRAATAGETTRDVQSCLSKPLPLQQQLQIPLQISVSFMNVSAAGSRTGRGHVMQDCFRGSKEMESCCFVMCTGPCEAVVHISCLLPPMTHCKDTQEHNTQEVFGLQFFQLGLNVLEWPLVLYN